MDPITALPNAPIDPAGPVSEKFLELGQRTFHDACRHVHGMPYGYNSDRDDPMMLFKEGKGSCTTKHAVIATLARELGLPVEKEIGVYAMTEDLVTGTDSILKRYDLPYIPMIHCFLAGDGVRVDLTEGNHNGKNRSIEEFLHTERVIPDIPAKDEYLRYRTALKEKILPRPELRHADMKTVLQARQEGVEVLKAKL